MLVCEFETLLTDTYFCFARVHFWFMAFLYSKNSFSSIIFFVHTENLSVSANDHHRLPYHIARLVVIYYDLIYNTWRRLYCKKKCLVGFDDLAINNALTQSVWRVDAILFTSMMNLLTSKFQKGKVMKKTNLG